MALAQSITVNSRTDLEKARAIHNWVAHNIWYDHDLSGGTIPQDAVSTLEKKMGVCDGYTALTVALLRAVSIPAMYILGDSIDEVHAWTNAYVDGRWIIMDSTLNSANTIRNNNRSPQRSPHNTHFDISIRTLSNRFSIRSINPLTIITELVIPDGITHIPNGAFQYVTTLTSVCIPNSVISIGASAFLRCIDLTSVILPNRLTRLEWGVFRGCANLKSVVIPPSVTFIDPGVFMLPYPSSRRDSEGRTIYRNYLITIYGVEGSAAEAFAREYGDTLNIIFMAGTPSNSNTFFDSASEWACSSIAAAANLGFVPVGMLQGSYAQPTTRLEFATMIVRMYERVRGGYIRYDNHRFTDTDDMNARKAAAIGVTTGTTPTTFNPNDHLTREQAAVMLSRLANAFRKPLPAYTATFADIGQLSAWSVEAVGQMQITGIMGGIGNNMFSPQGVYTREQSIVTLMRLYNIVANNNS
jgi:hypothetical protein